MILKTLDYSIITFRIYLKVYHCLISKTSVETILSSGMWHFYLFFSALNRCAQEKFRRASNGPKTCKLGRQFLWYVLS